MRYISIILASAALCTGSSAFAQSDEPHGFYGGLNAGVAALGDATLTYYDALGTFGGTTGSEDTFTTRFDFKSAAIVSGVVGYDFGKIRTDVEVSYARNTVRSFTLNAVNGTAISLTPGQRQAVCTYLETSSCGGSGNTFAISGSRIRQLNAMANVWLETPVGPVTPYVGGGLGVSGFEVDGEGKAKFAWQLGAGAAVQISPRLALTADYRHREVSNAAIAYDNVSGVRLNKLKTDSFTAGLRVYF